MKEKEKKKVVKICKSQLYNLIFNSRTTELRTNETHFVFSKCSLKRLHLSYRQWQNPQHQSMLPIRMNFVRSKNSSTNNFIRLSILKEG